MTAEKRWFEVERSEALAGLLLTSRSDLVVQSELKKPDGVDFYLAVNEGEPLVTRLFVVQVKGTTSRDPNEWMKEVKDLFQAGPIFLPVCVFVVNVRDNDAVYAWVAEPLVDERGAAVLRFRPPAAFLKLDESAVEGIVDQVKAFYAAIPRQLLPTGA